MWDDPIVAEMRQIREQIAAQFDYDVWALGEYFKSKRALEAVARIAKATRQTRRTKALKTNSEKVPL